MVTTYETKISLISKIKEVNIDIFKGPQYFRNSTRTQMCTQLIISRKGSGSMC